jgi:PBP1b-binding outer membrane lipoprotein LpoB
MRISLVVLVALMLAACSDEPQPTTKKAPEAPAAPITGRQAFQYVYGSALSL